MRCTCRTAGGSSGWTSAWWTTSTCASTGACLPVRYRRRILCVRRGSRRAARLGPAPLGSKCILSPYFVILLQLFCAHRRGAHGARRPSGAGAAPARCGRLEGPGGAWGPPLMWQGWRVPLLGRRGGCVAALPSRAIQGLGMRTTGPIASAHAACARTTPHADWLVGWFWGHSTAKNLRQLVRGPLGGRARIQLAGEQALGKGGCARWLAASASVRTSTWRRRHGPALVAVAVPSTLFLSVALTRS